MSEVAIITPTYPSLAANPLRLELKTYPVQFQLPTRFSDVAHGKRIGSIGMARYCEQARMQLLTTLLGKERLHSGTWKAFLRQISQEMLSAASFPETLTVGGGLRHIGNSSYSLGFGFFQGGVCVGLCDTTDVWVGDNGRPTAISDEFKNLLQKEALPL
ncbi:MAG: hypothetical protein RBS40_04040 [Rhodocyclaceae bacterium]|nr:hypothetical protein [Rhodocyclaceae bacterium]